MFRPVLFNRIGLSAGSLIKHTGRHLSTESAKPIMNVNQGSNTITKNTNGMKKFIFIVLAMGIFSSGCMIFKQPISGVKKGSAEDTGAQFIVSDVLLMERIQGLSDRLDEYRALERELTREGKDNSEALSLLRQNQRHAEGLHKTYRELQKLQRKLSKTKLYNRERATYRRMIDGLFQELTRLERGYFDNEHCIAFSREKVLKGYVGALKEIEEYCAQGDSLKIVESYQEAITQYGEDIIPVSVKLCYAEALSNTNQAGKAIRITEEVIFKESPDSISLYSNLIDWYLETESLEKALENFEKLSRELDRNMDIFLLSRNKITLPMHKESEHPAKKLLGSDIVEEDITPVGDAPRDTVAGDDAKEDKITKDRLKQIQGEKEGHPHEGLKGISASTEGKKYQGASEIPVKLKEDLQAHSNQNKGENEGNAFMPNEDDAKENVEKEKFMMAKRLMESGKYEEAVNELIELKDCERYGRKSQEMIRRSVDEFARHKRETAAKLFLLAKRTTDAKEKKVMLLRSFESLQEVIRKYPTSSYSGKIIKNIETVKEEILKIDPMFSRKESKPDEAIIK